MHICSSLSPPASRLSGWLCALTARWLGRGPAPRRNPIAPTGPDRRGAPGHAAAGSWMQAPLPSLARVRGPRIAAVTRRAPAGPNEPHHQ